MKKILITLIMIITLAGCMTRNDYIASQERNYNYYKKLIEMGSTVYICNTVAPQHYNCLSYIEINSVEQLDLFLKADTIKMP